MRGHAPVLALGCVAVLAAAAVTSGCATMARTKSDDQVFVDSNPEGAMVLVDGVPSGTTPQRVPMPRGHTIRVVCTLPGYRDASAVVHRELAPASAFDSPVLAAIDELTGAAYRLQRRTLFLELDPIAAP